VLQARLLSRAGRYVTTCGPSCLSGEVQLAPASSAKRSRSYGREIDGRRCARERRGRGRVPVVTYDHAQPRSVPPSPDAARQRDSNPATTAASVMAAAAVFRDCSLRRVCWTTLKGFFRVSGGSDHGCS
jgi:hypothetical protein